jgi:hypothetical protein
VSFPSFYASIYPCFNAGKIFGVGKYHAAWINQKTTVCASIVYVQWMQKRRIDGVWIQAYADDLVILSPSRIKLAETLTKLDSRFPEFNLTINLDKTEIMTFYPRGSRHVSQSTIAIRSRNLRQVDSLNYLGIKLTDTSSMTGHVDVVLQRAKVSLYKTVELLSRLSMI